MKIWTLIFLKTQQIKRIKNVKFSKFYPSRYIRKHLLLLILIIIDPQILILTYNCIWGLVSLITNQISIVPPYESGYKICEESWGYSELEVNENPPRVSRDLVQGFTCWDRIRDSSRLLKNFWPQAFKIHPRYHRTPFGLKGQESLENNYYYLETLTLKALAVSLFLIKDTFNTASITIKWLPQRAWFLCSLFRNC